MTFASWEDYAKAELAKAAEYMDRGDGCDYEAANYHATLANYYMMHALIAALRAHRRG